MSLSLSFTRFSRGSELAPFPWLSQTGQEGFVLDLVVAFDARGLTSVSTYIYKDSRTEYLK